MKVFISGVDTALGHNISRIFKNAKPGATLRNAEEESEENAENIQKGDTYTIVGTLSQQQPKYSVSKPGEMHYSGKPKRDAQRKEAIEKFNLLGVKPNWVSETFVDTQDIIREAISSDIIVFDIMRWHNEAQKVMEEIAKVQAEATTPKVFIGISSVMTWTRTVVDPEDPEASFTEQEYKRRRAHLDYKAHVEVERLILKLGKRENLTSYIVNTGLLIHPGDNILHSIFKDAWNLLPVKIYGSGENIVPISHIDDVSNAILYIAETKPSQKYILAVDEGNVALADVSKAISTEIGVSTTIIEPVENMLLERYVTKLDYDLIRVNLRMTPGQIKELGFDVKYSTGILENIRKISQEFKDARGFHPIKIVIHGPPGTGKSHLAQKLADYYKIPLVSASTIMNEVVAGLEKKIALNNEEESPEAKRNLDEIIEARQNNNNEWSRDHVIKHLRSRLVTKGCKNHGYVLDGCNFVQDELSELFKTEDDAPEDEENEGDPVSYELAPEFVFVLDASDEAICKRVMSMSDAELKLAPFSEEIFLKELANYRSNNSEDKTILNYLDEIEIHPKLLSAEESPEVLLQKIQESVGQPRNYGLDFEELEEIARNEQEKKKQTELAEASKQEAEQKEEQLKQQKEAAELEKKLLLLKDQEQQAIEVQSVPLRQYLMKHVMPTLTAGLVQVCKVRPEDPIDYLAEYLFSTQIDQSKEKNLAQ